MKRILTALALTFCAASSSLPAQAQHSKLESIKSFNQSGQFFSRSVQATIATWTYTGRFFYSSQDVYSDQGDGNNGFGHSTITMYNWWSEPSGTRRWGSYCSYQASSGCRQWRWWTSFNARSGAGTCGLVINIYADTNGTVTSSMQGDTERC